MNTRSEQPSQKGADLPHGDPIVAPLAEWNRRLGLPPQSRILRKEIAAGRLKALRMRPSTNAKLFLRAEDVQAWLAAAQGRAVARRT